jgi:Tol biopolymer transport system component
MVKRGDLRDERRRLGANRMARGRIVTERHQPLAEIGSGGMGTVDCARDRDRGTRVAVVTRHLNATGIVVLALVAVLAEPACGGEEAGLGAATPSVTATVASTSQPTDTSLSTATPTVSTPTPKAVPTPAVTPAATETARQPMLAFLRDGDIWVINADGSGGRRLTSWGDVDPYAGNIKWSPSGDMIGAERSSPTDQTTPKVTVIDLEGQILLEVPQSRFAGWSPRGSFLAYTGPPDQVTVVDPQGNEVLRLPNVWWLHWSPDETKIVYDRVVDLNCIKPRSTPVVLDLTDGSVWDIDPLSRNLDTIGFSPDGRWLACEQHLFDVSTHERRELPGLAVSWSPDSSYLTLVTGVDHDRVAIYDVAREVAVWEGDFALPPGDGSPASRVIGTWSPDGSHYLYMDWGQWAEEPRENATIIVEVATGRVVTGPEVERSVDVSPDSRYIAYSVYRQGGGGGGGDWRSGDELWIVGMDGTGRTRLGEGGYPEWRPVPMP